MDARELKFTGWSGPVPGRIARDESSGRIVFLIDRFTGANTENAAANDPRMFGRDLPCDCGPRCRLRIASDDVVLRPIAGVERC